MGKLGLRVAPTEGAVEQVVQRQRREPLLATNHMRNLHQVVIDDVGQVIGRQLVGRFVEHLVVERRGVDLHMATDQVVHLDHLTHGHLETNYPLVAACNARLDLLLRKTERSLERFTHLVVVGKGLAGRLGLLAECV